MKNIFKRKRGSEIIQTLIVIAIMGVLAITSILKISDNIGNRADIVDSKLDSSFHEAGIE